MNSNGHTFPIIPYNLLLDTDVGLYRVISKKYRNDSVFFLDPVDLDMPHLLYFLTHRQEANPIETIMIESNKDVAQEYYDQFMEKEIDEIMRESITTSIYDFVDINAGDRAIHFSIWVPNEKVEKLLKYGNADLFNKIEFRVSKNFYDCIEPQDEPIYVKNIIDLVFHIDKCIGKAVYLANYEFNYTWDKKAKKKGLNDNVGDIIGKRINITTYDPFRKVDMASIGEADYSLVIDNVEESYVS